MADESYDDHGGLPRPVRTVTWLVLGAAVMGVLALFAIRCELGPRVARAYPSRSLPPEPQPVLLPPPEMDEEYFPCSDCHEGETRNPARRELEDDHEDLALAHGDLWCVSCHDLENSDSLHLSDETLVGFEESWRLCTQCHGKKLAEWRAGIHGKRTGHWWGPKEYRNCVECHNPHTPLFAPLAPERPPVPPTEIRPTAGVWLREVTREAE